MVFDFVAGAMPSRGEGGIFWGRHVRFGALKSQKQFPSGPRTRANSWGKTEGPLSAQD